MAKAAAHRQATHSETSARALLLRRVGVNAYSCPSAPAC